MNSNEIYNAWKKEKRRITLEENFTEQVMNKVYQYEQGRNKPWFDIQRFVDVIFSHPLAKAGLVAAAAAVGFFRIVFMIGAVLGC